MTGHFRRPQRGSLDISKVKGTYVNFNSLTELLEEEPDIEEWQIVVDKPNDDPFEVDRMTLYCALAADSDPEAFTERTQRAVSTLTEVRFNEVIITSLQDMLERIGMEVNTKEERIADRRPGVSRTKERA